ncbi:protein of unknown function [Flavobacterium swingsii]|jgi:hypothetical protein|uniref:DUF4403 family protein n=1 Tax=Flavobacterium swingsii TaxID=498292 RepID=A0A1I0VRD0_9FLAO|nr:DUF4403 family protein [Flavobacterium swingsii]SFA78892.1 protein of unknown function [Flavobacterium swingsii]
MKNIFWIIGLFAMAIFYTGCSSTQKIELMKPEPDEATPINYSVTSSYISFPVNLTLKDIENQTNKALVGLIYDDHNIDDDKTEMKIWKNASILISEEDNKLKTIVPLKIWAKVRYGTSALGMNLYDTRELNLNGTVTFLSDVKMSNWKITTTTELQDFEWQESPTIIIAGKEIPITYLVNPTIRIFKSKIEKTIDESLEKSLDFKSNILEMMQKASEPFEMSPTYQTWLKVTPQEIYATEATLEKKAVSMTVGLKCLMESYIGQKPKPNFTKEKMVLKPISNLPEKVVANIAAVSTYQDASRVMTANFKGKEFGSGKRKVTIQNVEIWHKQGKMVIALDMLGSLNGRIYLSGFPQYNAETKELFFDDLDYALETKSKLMKTANWFAQSLILNKIRATCRYSIQPNLEEGKQNILKYLNNYSPMTGVFVNGKLNDIVFEKVQLTNNAIVAFLNITGNVKVNINGM